MIFQGTRASIAKKPYFCNYSWGGGVEPPSSPLDPRIFNVIIAQLDKNRLFLFIMFIMFIIAWN